MKLAYDARHLSAPYTGMARYSASLLQALLEGHDAPGLDVLVLLHRHHDWTGNPYFAALRGFEARGRCRLVYADVRANSLRQHLGFSRWIDALQADHYFHPHFDAPLGVRTPMTFVVHDLIPLLVPGYIQRAVWLKRRYFRLTLGRALHRAQHCYASSQNTRADLLRVFGQGHAGKVHCCYPGLSPELGCGQDEAGVLPALPERFLMYVGDRRPHKNLRRIVDLFDQLCAAHGYTGSLLLAGSPADHGFDLDAHLAARPRVQVLGNVSDAVLQHLYRHADAMLLISQYEGFGFPVVEAARWGCKVVVSDAGSLPEIAPPGSCILPNGDPVPQAAAALAAYLRDERRPDAEAVQARYRWQDTARTLFPYAYRQATAAQSKAA